MSWNLKARSFGSIRFAACPVETLEVLLRGTIGKLLEPA